MTATTEPVAPVVAKPAETLETRLNAVHVSFDALRSIRSSILANKQLLPSDFAKYSTALDACIEQIRPNITDRLFYGLIDVADYLHKTKEARSLDAMQLLLVDPRDRTESFARFMNAAHDVALNLTGPFLLGKTDIHHVIQLAKRLAREAVIEKTITPYAPVVEPAPRSGLSKAFGRYIPDHKDGFAASCDSVRKLEKALGMAQEQGYAFLQFTHDDARTVQAIAGELNNLYAVAFGTQSCMIPFDTWNSKRLTEMNGARETLTVIDPSVADIHARLNAPPQRIFPYGNGSQVVLVSNFEAPIITMANSLLPAHVVEKRLASMSSLTADPEPVRDALEAVYVRTRSFTDKAYHDVVAVWTPSTKK